MYNPKHDNNTHWTVLKPRGDEDGEHWYFRAGLWVLFSPGGLANQKMATYESATHVNKQYQKYHAKGYCYSTSSIALNQPFYISFQLNYLWTTFLTIF